MSNYPDGAANDPRAPYNQKDPVMKQCSNCEGDGFVLEKPSDSPEYEKVECDDCEGLGNVEMTDDEIEDAEGDRKYDSWKNSQLEEK